MAIRKDRMADEIRDLLALAFSAGKINDPALTDITVTAVKLSGDLQQARVYFRLFDATGVDRALQGLNRANGFLRRQLADSLQVKRLPSLKFFYDESIDRGARMEQLLTGIGAN